MKGYTDLEQSKKLAEILPVESADMVYVAVTDKLKPQYDSLIVRFIYSLEKNDVPAWSLTALLKVMPSEIKDNHYLTLEKETFETSDEYCCCYEDCNGNSFKHCFSNNPIDACYEMIIKLHEQNIL